MSVIFLFVQINIYAILNFMMNFISYFIRIFKILSYYKLKTTQQVLIKRGTIHKLIMLNIAPQIHPTLKKIDNYVFNFDDMLGQGNFSKVYRGINEITKQTVAIKVIELNSLKSKKLQQLLFSQIDVLKKLNHPNVLKCYEVFTSNRNCYIITEICNGGDLQTLLKKYHHFSEEQAQPYILDVFKGLKYLAENHVIHRDIKVANIFLHNGSAKIADFGFAKFTAQNFKDINIGSPIYMSPEGFIDNIYGPKTDIWAYGIFIYQLMHGKTPFSHCNNENDLRRQIRTPISYSSLRNQLSFQLKDVIINCLQINQEKRYTIFQLQQMEYFRRLLKFDVMPLGGKKHQFLNVNNIRSKALTPSHNNINEKIRGQSLGNSMQKTKINAKNFYNAFQNHGSKNFGTQPRSINSPKQSNFFNPGAFRSNNLKNTANYRHNSTQKSQNFISSLNKNLPPNIPYQSANSIKANSNRDQYPKKPRIESVYLNVNQKSPVIHAIPGYINFKQAVNALHYCRLIYKCIMSSRQLEQSQYRFTGDLSALMFKILGQISSKIQNKQIAYDQETNKKEVKLREVSNEYYRKYMTDIERPFNREVSYQMILSQVKQKIQQYESLYLQRSGTPTYLHLLHSLLVIYESTMILRKCSTQCKYLDWGQYKFIQDFLSWNKNSMNYQSFLDMKNRVFKN